MNAIPANYFDGLNTLPHPVTLVRDADDWLIEGEGVHLLLPANQVGIPPAVGQSVRFLRLPEGGHCEVSDSTALAQLEQATSTKPDRISQLVHFLESKARPVAAATLVLVAGLVAAFYLALPRLAARIANAIPASVEQRISQHTMEVFDNSVFGYSVLGQHRQEEIRQAFASFLKASGHTGRRFQIKFRRMAGDAANAFALPNGTLIVTDGLVNLAQDDDELMAVLAHEIGHCEHHHGLRMILQDSAAFVFAVSLLGDTSAISNIAGALPLILTSKKYSRDFETEADRYALHALQRAEVPLYRFVDIMERMEASGKHGEPLRYISTHPPTADRLIIFREAQEKKN